MSAKKAKRTSDAIALLRRLRAPCQDAQAWPDERPPGVTVLAAGGRHVRGRVTPTPCGFVALEALGAAGYYSAPRSEWPAAIDQAIAGLGASR